MKKRTVILIAIITLLAAGLGLGIFFLRPTAEAPAPSPPPPTAEEPEGPVLPEERHAVLDLYFGTSFALRDIDRMELTLARADLITEDGLEYLVSESSSRIMVQNGVAQKVLSERMFHGRHAMLRLTFGPTARIFRNDGTSEVAFLPSNRMHTRITTDMPLSRTLAALVTLPVSTSLGSRDGTPTIILPSSAPVETHVLGGFLLDPRGAGDILEPEEMSIAGVIEADLGLDINPREGPRGSEGFSSSPGEQPGE